MGTAEEAGKSLPSRYDKKFFPQLLASLFAACASASNGIAHGWAVPVALQLEQDVGGLGLDMDQRAWVVSAVNLGAAAGCFLGGKLCGRYGPRGVFIISITPYILGSIMMFLSKNMLLLLAGRLVTGCASGLTLAVYMLYVSGSSSPKYRGVFSIIPDVVSSVFMILAIVLGNHISWNWLSIICCAVTYGPVICLLLVMPHDPVWLLSKGRLTEAKKSAEFFGVDLNSGDVAKLGLQDEQGDVGCLKSVVSTMKMLKERKNWAPLCVVIAVFFFTCFSGYMAILYYSLVFFSRAGLPLDASLCTVVFIALKVVGTVSISFFIDRIGRRPLMLTSAFGAAVNYACLVLYYQVPYLQQWPFLPVIFVLGTALFFSLGVAPVPWCLVGEMFPLRMRELGGSVIPVMYCLFSYIAVFMFPRTLKAVGESGIFMLNFCVIAAFFAFEYFVVPETQGLTLMQIETLFVKDAKSKQLTSQTTTEKELSSLESGKEAIATSLKSNTLSQSSNNAA